MATWVAETCRRFIRYFYKLVSIWWFQLPYLTVQCTAMYHLKLMYFKHWQSGQIWHCSIVDRANKYYGLYTTSAPPPPNGATAPSGPGPPHCPGYTITLRHTTLGRTPLHEWSAPRKNLYLTNATLTETDIHAPGGILTRNPSKWKTAVPRFSRRGHWDRRYTTYLEKRIIFAPDGNRIINFRSSRP
jgi:hypothetical protein